MRALLTPEVAPMTGVVIFRPGSELMHLFRRGRVLIEPQTESMAELPKTKSTLELKYQAQQPGRVPSPTPNYQPFACD